MSTVAFQPDRKPDPDFRATLLGLVPQLRGFARIMLAGGPGIDESVEACLIEALSRYEHRPLKTPLQILLLRIMSASVGTRGLAQSGGLHPDHGNGPRQNARRLVVAGTEAALRQLPLEQREALYLVAMADMPHKEAAAVIGVSVEALKTLLIAARLNLQSRLTAGAPPVRPLAVGHR
jgi:RNA polymerase sigma-70 factor (ECF subfamily)